MNNNISNICENLYSYCLKCIPQIENGEFVWILNGSVLCNILYNVIKINNKEVTNEFHDLSGIFVRPPKGDIDILYKPDRQYIFDLSSKEINDFYSISDEERTYNFVDSNDVLSEMDIKQLCLYETKNGLKFYAKKPQYIFLYKFKEYVAMFYDEILSGDNEAIHNKRKNIISDAKVLYQISCEFIGKNETEIMLKDNLLFISKFFHDLYKKNKTNYREVISISLNSLANNNLKKI